MKKYLWGKIIAILLITILLGIFNLPNSILTDTKLHLGLDLQGGSQLDYKIDLRKVPEADREGIVNGVLKVIEKRVNGLGVAEPNIYTSQAADETHIIVELAETANVTQEDVDSYLGQGKLLADLNEDEKKVVGLEKAKATVGKTIQLEFKEEKGEADPEEVEKIEANAASALQRIKDGSSFSVIGQEEMQAYPGKVNYETVDFTFESDLNTKVKDAIIALKKGEITQNLVETGGEFALDQNGQAVENTGLAMIKLLDTKEEVKNPKEVSVSHILIAHKGATKADESITRSKDEAYKRAKEVIAKLDAGDDFATLAQEYSDDTSNKDQGGRLETPVTGEGTYVYDFEKAALDMKKAGEISKPVETEFGYHIIKANEISENVKETKYKYDIITFSTVPDPWKESGLTGKNFVHADMQLDNFYQPYVTIQFDEEGGKLFEEITGRNVGKRVAIFVGGELISAPNVNEKITGGSAQITGQFTTDEAKALAENLNTGAIPAPIILTGEYTIGATLGQEALNKSLLAGFIGFLLVMIFMVLYYRIPGLIADIALLTYGAILFFLLKAQLHLGLALLISIVVFSYLIIKVINNKDSGFEKLVAFLLSCAAFFFLTYLLKTGVVLTLAGIAGVIMSIGMAVDANVLIFERFKEEMREGKTYAAAIESGFEKAWSAIRDSNFTTLLICAVLFAFGSSTIKGFAFTLAAGVVVSMFTAITVTRTLMLGLTGRPITQNLKMMGVSARKNFNLAFIKNSKLWLAISGAIFAVAVLAMLIFGLNLGFDFTGGTLMEFKFEETVAKTNLETAIKDAGKTLSTTENPIDLSSLKIIEGGENDFIIKTKYLTSDIHDKLISELENKLPAFSEPRFATVGPVIGKTLLMDATKAIIISLVIIILYVAFAFRKVPKEVSPWRFGATAIITLIHDVTIVAGFFVLLGLAFNVEIDALFITAMLTVFGYSVNDTIIIFDKVRDNLITASRDEKFADITNRSLNETLTRSLNTGLTTILTLIAILLFGSSNIFFFVLALTLGITLGTYSSIFVASPALVLWNNYAEKKKAVK